MNLEVEFPEKLGFLFEPHRYKGAYGGRGSAKSWSFARALLLLGRQNKLRILCTREVQKSIKDSVHKLLKDQIETLGLGSFYEVLDTVIRGRNGTEFLFSGLKEHTVNSIKSFEGCDICWVEEAHAVSKGSWKILIPTIRKDGSEIWLTFNPELESDETYDRFVTNKPDNAVIVKMNHSDNPWFPQTLELERRADKEKLQEAEYNHIWEGFCKPAVEGAIYFNEIAKAEAQRRIRNVPMDPALKVHRIWDMGWNDAMAIILAQRCGNEIAIVGYVTGQFRTLADYIAEFKDEKYRGWNWGFDFLPHDGFHASRQTGKSDAAILRGLGCEVRPTPNIGREQGIRNARLVFPRVFIDKENTKAGDSSLPGLVECLKRYRRQTNQQQTAGDPLHDVHSNGADAFRYLCLNAEQMTNEDSNEDDSEDWGDDGRSSVGGY